MDVGKRMLEKYGWKEGKGLGKNETGISEPIKPKLKFDTAGIGHDASEEFTHNWWDSVYNRAASNIKVAKTDNEVSIVTDSNTSVLITNKKHVHASNNNSLEYGAFIKTAKLTQSGTVDLDRPKEVEVSLPVFVSLTDDQLFAACAGRTAHKGARHGFKQNGKLKRLEKQEKRLLKRVSKLNLSDDNRSNRKKKHKGASERFLENVLSVDSRIEDYSKHENKTRIEKTTEESVEVHCGKDKEDPTDEMNKKMRKALKKKQKRKSKTKMTKPAPCEKCVSLKQKRKREKKKISKISKRLSKFSLSD